MKQHLKQDSLRICIPCTVLYFADLCTTLSHCAAVKQRGFYYSLIQTFPSTVAQNHDLNIPAVMDFMILKA